jgi:phosphoglycerol transferase MdoB-like AlkP superfamily enzyme
VAFNGKPATIRTLSTPSFAPSMMLSARIAIGFFAGLICFVVLFFSFRLILLLQHSDLYLQSTGADVLKSFFIGARFDLRMASYAVLPLVLTPIFPGKRFVKFSVVWLSTFAAIYSLLAFVELEFYREFAQRLNGLAIQYIKEDAQTVAFMIWHSFPVIRYLLVLLLVSAFGFVIFRSLVGRINPENITLPWNRALPLVLLLLFVDVLVSRGTLRQGPPLRWGDAYHSDVMFLNQLALNGSFTFAKAVINQRAKDENSKWVGVMTNSQALEITRKLLVSEREQLVDAEHAAVRRIHNNPTTKVAPPNIVIVLMESFSGQFVGSLTGVKGITPEFDRLSRQGVLFQRAFSNGTHTHQGIFTTLSCFPNLPSHEYLMQQPEGRNQFSGLTTVLPDHSSLFVYNGDFNWDNQYGFFSNQGMQEFIGRYDFDSPILLDPVWGVSDEDMFNRAELELDRLSKNKQPFFAVLQTLSNHIPYNIPNPERFTPVTDHGELSDRLTAMRYSDWALGQFFRNIETRPYYENTIFVVVGDHGFGTRLQLTEVNLLRFHVPLLIIGPGLRQFVTDTIATQVDVIPTILGRLGEPKQHQCWGRDLLDIKEPADGFAIIKPSGDEFTMAIIQDKKMLTFDHSRGGHLYDWTLYPRASASPVSDDVELQAMQTLLQGYVQTALTSLRLNTTGSGE